MEMQSNTDADTITPPSHSASITGKTKSPLSPWTNTTIVTTQYGKIRGKADKEGTWCWKGIPYGQPPTGPLRWKAPLAPLPWEGIRRTSQFSKPAAQAVPVVGYIGSEDCLYLNIWRPATGDKHLPVYMFIHGGGNSISSGTIRDYHGYRFASRSHCVFVSLNYRLGAIGWFIHPAVTGNGSREDRSGNFGTLDIIKTLEWIRGNISAFGGDPGNVTIAGESGGGMNVLSLLTSSRAQGLFHKAVSESGLTLMWPSRVAVSQSRELLINLVKKNEKVRTAGEAEKLIQQMTDHEIDTLFRSAPAKRLMKLIPKSFFGMAQWMSIFRDGYVLPEEGFKVLEDNTRVNRVPLIVGCTKDEMKLFGMAGKGPRRSSGLYHPLWTFRSLIWQVSGLYNVGTWIASHSKAPPVYAYRFDWGSPDVSGNSVLPGKLGPILGACHYMEVPFFLGMGEPAISFITGKLYTRRNRKGREKLTALCMDYLKNFIHTGDPNGRGLPPWRPWDKEAGRDKILVLDADNRDLRLSTIKKCMSTGDVLEQIKSELHEPELSAILSMLDKHIPLGFREDDDDRSFI